MSKVTEKELREWFAKEGYAQQGPILADVIRIFRDKGLLAPPPNKPLLAEFAERYMPHPGSRHCPVIVLGVPLERVDTHQAALNAVRDRLTRYHVPGGHTGCVICEIVNDGIREGLWTAPEGWEEKC